MSAKPRKTAFERFWSRVRIDSPCWEWTGSGYDGYGRFADRGKSMGAHRWIYQQMWGEIPKDLVVMHSCDNPGCVRPAHLRAGTHKENMEDCSRKGRISKVGRHVTHCWRGHEFTPANTYIYRTGKGRACRACDVLRKRIYKSRKHPLSRKEDQT